MKLTGVIIGELDRRFSKSESHDFSSFAACLTPRPALGL
jgi:hypothetical protein